MIMLLATLLFGGGLLFWVGLLSGQRVLLLGGGVLLGALFAWMVELGSIHPAVLPALAGIAALAWALETNRFPAPTGEQNRPSRPSATRKTKTPAGERIRPDRRLSILMGSSASTQRDEP